MALNANGVQDRLEEMQLEAELKKSIIGKCLAKHVWRKLTFM
jgi:hypothetical protein